MNPVDQPMTEPSATNGVSLTTNGDASAHITDQTQFQLPSQLQSRSTDKTQSISAGVYQYTGYIALDQTH